MLVLIVKLVVTEVTEVAVKFCQKTHLSSCKALTQILSLQVKTVHILDNYGSMHFTLYYLKEIFD